MSDAKLDRILERLEGIQGDVATLKTDVATLKTDVATLKTDVATLKTDIAGVANRQNEMLTAFRKNWSDMSGLYRGMREELLRFENKIVETNSKVIAEIAVLKELIQAHDLHNRELARRMTDLETGAEPPL